MVIEDLPVVSLLIREADIETNAIVLTYHACPTQCACCEALTPARGVNVKS
jgi:hypothetical protein